MKKTLLVLVNISLFVTACAQQSTALEIISVPRTEIPGAANTFIPAATLTLTPLPTAAATPIPPLDEHRIYARGRLPRQ